jgi:PIN domain nuclease of toxin-antitoxin system
MTPLLLDTHVWLWYVLGIELKKSIVKTITEALEQGESYVAAISLWEVAMLSKKKRIIFEMPCLEWINKAIELTRIQVVPLSPAIAAESCHLPGKFHEDPADRMIVASARVTSLTLVTRDKNILEYSSHKYISILKA